MSTRFENKLILPRGPMGPTTLMGLPQDDIDSVARWHRSEWEQFLTEIKAYKFRVLDAARSTYLRNLERALKCEKCRKRRAAIMRAFKGPRFQRGTIQMAGLGLPNISTECSFTASTIPNLSDSTIEPAFAYTRARLHSDGDWYSSTGSTSFGASDGTWDGDCAIADYDTRWNTISGDAPNGGVSGSNGVWHAATTSAALGLSQLSFGSRNGSYDLELRDGTTLNVLFTDAFTMFAFVDAKN